MCAEECWKIANFGPDLNPRLQNWLENLKKKSKMKEKTSWHRLVSNWGPSVYKTKALPLYHKVITKYVYEF